MRAFKIYNKLLWKNNEGLTLSLIYNGLLLLSLGFAFIDLTTQHDEKVTKTKSIYFVLIG